MDFILLIIGFALLIKGADIFVDGSSSVAKKLGIPSVIVGLTIISLGTSAPELAVSIISAVDGNSGITLGNVIGSNLFNTLVVLGATAMVAPLIIKKALVKRDFIVNIGATVLLFVLLFGLTIGKAGNLTRGEGIILLVCTIIYTVVLIISAKKTNSEEEKEDTSHIKIGINIIKIVIGIAGIVIGGDIVVDSASNIAQMFGMSKELVGLTIVAVGTSLPELVTSVVAALKGETEIALGNVLGSNIFNILLIIGASATISPMDVATSFGIDLIILVIVALIIGAMVFRSRKEETQKISRWEGLLLIGIYIGYLAYIIMRN